MSHWFDDEAGPVVRPYAMTRGRTTSAAQHRLDLIAVVVTEPHADDPGADQTMSPEHEDIVDLCRDAPQSVAELAAEPPAPRLAGRMHVQGLPISEPAGAWSRLRCLIWDSVKTDADLSSALLFS